VYQIITTSGLELDPALGTKFATEPSNWRHYYIEKDNAVNGTEAQNNALVDEGEEEYIKAQKDLQSFQDSQDVTILSRVASKLVWILGRLKKKISVCSAKQITNTSCQKMCSLVMLDVIIFLDLFFISSIDWKRQ
jgi:hypothetical protein